MPREGSGIEKTANGRWNVRFKIKETTVDADGQPKTVWRSKERAFDSKADAEDFRAEIRLTASRGEVWKDKREIAPPRVATLGEIADAYCKAASNAPVSTQRWRRSIMNGWLSWAGRETKASDLCLSLLERYADSLPSDGRKASTRHRKVLAVEAMWVWARKRPDLFPGVPEPMEITGNDAESVKPPPPVVRIASPNWDDVDSMLVCLGGGWKYGSAHRRVGLLLRYTGMRVSQAIGLRWSDVRLDHPAGAYVIIRAGRRGSKSSRGRVVPLHEALVREMRTWGAAEGMVLDPPEGAGGRWQSGEATRMVMRTAWRQAGVDAEKWDISEAEREAGERGHGSPCHAIKACVKTELIRAGVPEAIADYFVGHSKGATTAAYVPESAPETSPYWPHLKEAVAKIPAHSFGPGNIED